MSDKPLRLKEVKICGYRAFPHLATIRLNSKNLLLFGENGSGKSSFGKSLRDFLDFRAAAVSFDQYKYRFVDPPRSDRKIELVFDDATTDVLQWNPTQRETSHKEFNDMARSRAWLDYRSVWRISEVVESNDYVEIFTPLIEEILTSCLPLSGGTTTFGSKWKEIVALAEQKPKKYGTVGYNRVTVLNGEIKQFNLWIDSFLPELEKAANKLLEIFVPWTKLELTKQTDTSYSSRLRYNKFCCGSIHLRMLFRENAPLPTPSEFINESRITAIGLCLYLAGMAMSIPPKRADDTTYPRLLILDDVLLSLDMVHRLPLLHLLKDKTFEDWQIILLTHDRAWYEIGKQQLPSSKWSHIELFSRRVGDYEQPLLRDDKDHLDWALEFLEQGHVKAAAVHIRTKFEEVLKRACSDFSIPVKYHPDPRQISVKDFWGSVEGFKWKERQGVNYHRNCNGTLHKWMTPAHEHPIVSEDLRHRIQHALSWVMNPLSHSQSVDRHTAEIEDAIFAVLDLETAIEFALKAKSIDPAAVRKTVVECLQKRLATQLH